MRDSTGRRGDGALPDEAACERPRRARKGGVSQDPRPVTLQGPCRLRVHQKPGLQQWPASPQLTSGYLAAENSGWRTLRPKIEDSACICCNLCVLLCPDGALANTRDNYPRLLAEWCKGCGICARECPKDAIVMASEFEPLSAEAQHHE
ncbi:4Fe-4S binding protein [Brenneria izadpanahii]|uniref:4Fe-4S binding protein n=1 Tax=Brenneria izadpanahii TaxID=2722756 RepID=A0ABX7UUD0_9GAMM|nr:4Fe-4S dicluster-binding protein [Brenneria izadpanahii]QTF09204.1 4Fe-4S binding protein [Brenneria izadpanahii]